MPHDNSILEQATNWAVRVGDPVFEEWDEFTRWLAQDPAHSEAYDRISAAVADAAELARAEPVAVNDGGNASPLHALRWRGAAIAASLAVLLAVGVWQMQDDRYTVQTAPGESRTVALPGSGNIELAGNTRLEFDRDDPRFARLEEGQAMFSIEHDPVHPFTLHLDGDTLVDLGTAFDVRRDRSGVTVTVAEGKVAFNPRTGTSVRLEPGTMLVVPADSASRILGKIPVDQVGEWRQGRLTFRQDSMSEIADRLSSATGISFSAGPENSDETYSGSVLTGPLRKDPRMLGPLLGVKVTPVGDGWLIETQ